MKRMAGFAATAEAKRAEARRLLAEADAEAADLERLETWIARVSGRGLIMLVAWGHLQPAEARRRMASADPRPMARERGRPQPGRSQSCQPLTEPTA